MNRRSFLLALGVGATSVREPCAAHRIEHGAGMMRADRFPDSLLSLSPEARAEWIAETKTGRVTYCPRDRTAGNISQAGWENFSILPAGKIHLQHR